MQLVEPFNDWCARASGPGDIWAELIPENRSNPTRRRLVRTAKCKTGHLNARCFAMGTLLRNGFLIFLRCTTPLESSACTTSCDSLKSSERNSVNASHSRYTPVFVSRDGLEADRRMPAGACCGELDSAGEVLNAVPRVFCTTPLKIGISNRDVQDHDYAIHSGE